MYAPPEAKDHPLLEGQYIGFYRLECDDNYDREVCTPLVVRLVQEKLQVIFSVETDIQDVYIGKVEERFRKALQKHNITSIISPFFTVQFFGFPRFLNLDSPERQEAENYDVIKNWVEYGGMDDQMNTEGGKAICEELGIKMRGYYVEKKQFFDSLV